ncbi:MAG: anthranilate synthase component I family protein [Candidatus Eremiobacteraeota bacterium]|nr:anthranilate synthase component I family protein [Candidatus Eremiobacteraeota bacterium]
MTRRLTAKTDSTCERVLADGVTPIAAFAALRGLLPRPAFLFESSPAAGQAARYSIIGMGSRGEVVASDGAVRVHIHGRATKNKTDPLSAARDLLHALTPSKPGSAFAGAYGAAAFEFASYLERLPQLPRGRDPMPDLHLVVPQALVVFDHLTHEVEISAEGADCGTIVREAASRLGHARLAPLACGGSPQPLELRPSALPYAGAIARAQAAIRAGEAFQVVLAQRLDAPLVAAPFDAYRALRSINPSPYMFFLDFGWGELLGSSPEALVTLAQGRARVRPLAGTRARAADSHEDARRERDLRRDAKELAEHMMLVDLGRNDLARACEYGSVRVSEMLSVERYSHVMHLVSEVTGALRAGCDAFDLFAAAFPAGTVSGAPKIRAMQLIVRLEGKRRGFYAGSVCRFGFDGSLDACITLRSAHAYGGRYHCAAGAGIVSASDATSEDAECRAKAGALAAAIGQARRASPGRHVA